MTKQAAQLVAAAVLGYLAHALRCWFLHGEQLAAYDVWRENGYLMPSLRPARDAALARKKS